MTSAKNRKQNISQENLSAASLIGRRQERPFLPNLLSGSYSTSLLSEMVQLSFDSSNEGWSLKQRACQEFLLPEGRNRSIILPNQKMKLKKNS